MSRSTGLALLTMLVLVSAFLAASPGLQARPGSDYPESRVRWYITDMAVDDDGSIYVMDHESNNVIRLDKDGNLIWRTPLTSPDGAKLDAWNMHLVDQPQKALVIGLLTGMWALTPDGKISLLVPPSRHYADTIAAASSNGLLYVLDTERNQVIVRSRKATTQTDSPSSQPDAANTVADPPQTTDAFTSKMVIDGNVQGPAHFGRPRKVRVNKSGTVIWILDQSFTFNVFDGSGKFIREITPPDKKHRSFTYVYGLAFDSDGNAYVACTETHCILKYDQNGNLVRTIPGIWGNAFAIGPDGGLYYADGYHGIVTKLDKNGRRLKEIRLPGS